MSAWSALRRCFEDLARAMGVVEKRFKRGERQFSLGARNREGWRAIVMM